jgi:hypothetical protein
MRLKCGLLAVVWTIFINGGVQLVVAATSAAEAEADRARRKLKAMQVAAKRRR